MKRCLSAGDTTTLTEEETRGKGEERGRGGGGRGEEERGHQGEWRERDGASEATVNQ